MKFMKMKNKLACIWWLLTFDDEGRYVITRDTYTQLVKVINVESFNKHLKDLCGTPGAKVSYYFISKFEDVLEL